jgi:hypothetical protein
VIRGFFGEIRGKSVAVGRSAAFSVKSVVRSFALSAQSLFTFCDNPRLSSCFIDPTFHIGPRRRQLLPPVLRLSAWVLAPAVRRSDS